MDSSDVIRLINEARAEGWAMPAINVSSVGTAMAAMQGLEDAASPGFVQVSIGAAKTASRTEDPVEGAIVLGRLLRDLRRQYDVPVILHTDHCHHDMVEVYLKPLLKRLHELYEAGEEKIFDSFMYDGSTTGIRTNAATIRELAPLVKDVDGVLEVEAGGAWGGSEDGVGGGAKYSTPEDVAIIQTAMSASGLDSGDYLLAVAFGNAHGTAVVPDLKPGLLSEIAAQTGQENLFVFHGGSGSPEDDIRAAVANGVVKMNVDTDTQYAFTNAIMDHMLQAPFVGEPHVDTDPDAPSKAADAIVDGDYGKAIKILAKIAPSPAWGSHKEGKKWFDPRRWDAAGREGMAQHVDEVAHLLGSAGRAQGANCLRCI